MDVKTAIETRRSIRRYNDREVTEDVIRALLEAARLSPSGCNAQPWRFFIVRDEDTKKKLIEKKAFQQKFVYRAPVIFVCCGDPTAYAGKYGGEYQVEEGSVPADPAQRKKMFSQVEGKEKIRAIRDISIATGFMVLRATELDLGTSYIGLINEEVLKETLDIPERYVIPYVITCGYFDKNPPMRPRIDIEKLCP